MTLESNPPASYTWLKYDGFDIAARRTDTFDYTRLDFKRVTIWYVLTYSTCLHSMIIFIVLALL